MQQPKAHEGLSLIYDSIWHFNIAYAIWDGLYPAFVALREWGRQGEKFRSVVGVPANCSSGGYSHVADDHCMAEDVFETFGGNGMLKYPELQGWHSFSDSIAGSGRKGYRSINQDYDLPGGRDLDAARLFRDRMYSSHGLPIPKARKSSAADREFPLRGIIIRNGRFKTSEVELLQKVAKELSTDDFQLDYIDYRKGDLAGNFTKQLEMIGSLTFHISGPGTSQSYGPLLPDGSVHINLGDRRPAEDDPYKSGMNNQTLTALTRGSFYMEEQWSEGIPYIKALFYDPFKKLPGEFTQSGLTALILEARTLVQSDFALPVARGDNLSPLSRVFTDYCRAIGSECNIVLSEMNGDDGSKHTHGQNLCITYSWSEWVVFEAGPYADSLKNNETESCPLPQRELLRQVRHKQYGW
jgi:hypothetical protein